MGEVFKFRSGHFVHPKTAAKKDAAALAWAVAKARECSVPYKILMALTGLGRSRLDQLRIIGKNPRKALK